MTVEPLVSIVLPTYNGERYLAESIESVIAQTYRNWELIIVDDGSTDSTPQIIASYAAADARIRNIRNAVNRKLPASLNTGFVRARGEYFTWTSDDNRYRPRALEVMLQTLRADRAVSIVYAGYTTIDAEGRALHRVPAAPLQMLGRGNVINACFLYRREVHEVLGGYCENMFLLEDYDFWLRASTKFRIQALDCDLYEYRQHAASLTARRRYEIEEKWVRLLSYHLPRMRWMPDQARAESFRDLALRAHRLGRRWHAACLLVRCALLEPRLVMRLPKRVLAAIVFGHSAVDAV
jgi:glycosyltransferase involved in cell wall biosynthesis